MKKEYIQPEFDFLIIELRGDALRDSIPETIVETGTVDDNENW